MTLGERLLKYRTEAKMSQDVLAEKLGVTRQTISKWETDQSTPEFNKILPLCELYGITTDELIKGEVTQFQEKKENVKQEQQLAEEEEIYQIKRNKKKAIIISISVFLYSISTFSFPYVITTLEYDPNQAVAMMMGMWTIATVLLIYFFISYPKKRKIVNKSKETIKIEKEKK